MFKIAFILFSILSISYANIFTITDKRGRIVHSKTIHHTKNAFLYQKTNEYIMADELKFAAALAKLSNTNVKKVKKAQKRVIKKGHKSTLSQREKEKLLQSAKYFKGGKYLWGGTTPKGFDCSGYVQYLYKKYNIKLPRTALAQSKRGKKVSKNRLQKGDLLFFLTDRKRGIPITHVGIYIGKGKFIHAASKKRGIIVSPIRYGYYAKKFIFAKRVV